MKRIKRVAGVLAVLSCAGVVLCRILFREIFTIQEAGSLGIIGSADDPTVIYTTGTAETLRPFFYAVPLVILAIWLILHLSMKKK